MKRFSQRGIYNPVADINIVPLMDLVFNLLIVFMLATPLLEQSITIKLPAVHGSKTTTESNVTIVNLDAEGRLFLDRTPLRVDELEKLAEEGVKADPQYAILIRGDERVPYGKFVELVDRLKKVGVTRLGIIGITAKN